MLLSENPMWKLFTFKQNTQFKKFKVKMDVGDGQIAADMISMYVD